MVAQTLASPATSRALVFNGEFVKLGYLSDIAHGGEMHESMNLGFQLVRNNKGGSSRKQEIEIDVKFFTSPDPDPNTTKVYVVATSLRTSDVKIRANAQVGSTHLDKLYAIKNWQIPDAVRREISSGLFNFDLDEDIGSSNKKYCSLSHFLPSRKLVHFNMGTESIRNALEISARVLSTDASVKERLWQDIEFFSPMGRAIKEELGKVAGRLRRGQDLRSEVLVQELAMIEDRLYRSSSLLEWVESISIRISTRTRKALARELLYHASRIGIQQPSKEDGLKAEPFSPEVVQATNEIVDFFTKRMRYLGPLRDDPRMVYGIPLIPDSKDVGIKGEYTAAVLERFGKDTLVECPLPPDGDYSPLRSTKMSLIDAVILWLHHMELVDNVVTQDRGKMGVELTLSSDGLNKQLDLTNVGVGVSQVLPILTMCLLAPDDGLILLEQPELHLHPRVQMMLSDFFLGIAAKGTQCVIETHSDRIINRIRRRIAEDESDDVMHLAKFYFFEKSGIETLILPVEPNGFFDEGPDEAQRIALAANRKREVRMQKGSKEAGSKQ